MNIKNRSRKQSNKRDGIGDGRMRLFPFSSDDLVKTRQSESKAEAKDKPTTIPFPRFMTGLLLLLLLPTLYDHLVFN